MRIKLKMTFTKLNLPINYNSIIQGFIYNNISDEKFRKFLHDKGFKYEKRNFKLFTFSRIEGKYQIDKKRKRISFESPIYITISSLVDEFLNDFGNTVLNEKEMYLGDNKINIENMEVENKNINNEEIDIKMLSPIVIYSTVDIHGHKKTIYHAPGEALFDELIYENLKKKYNVVYNEEINNEDFNILPKRTYPVITRYKGFIIKGWLGEFKVRGDKKLLKLAYDTGFGSKNSQGFGCFEIRE
ncbi:CRISPR-associated endoribonuclease Cas6 [Clostridium sp. D2Q-14]|uniref:CRISPR-associated endoribonuclease Cas6 n=1 Tax=Anaeromonas gelatinilytica TaxID=2683194 RepID=UPI00193B5D75|nr:CRISPR-associated endoribonuclease Cas6 [Anaeromonas gelatinilytica]MBS4535598.1 CRISPR-associated endoribonuclease Cas6 [Anaeromonas gelatinilytica]